MLPDNAHDWHAPSQALSQQTPSTQLPLLHWAFAAADVAPLQVAPFGLRPQLLGVVP